MNLKNNYFIVRHGYSLRNAKNIVSCWPEKMRLPLTKRGVKEAKKAALIIKKKKIDLIFYSDLLRTKQTADIIAKEIKIKPRPDKRLREINLGILNGKKTNEVGKFWNKGKNPLPLEHYKNRFKIAPPKGETYREAEKRLLSFIKETEKNFKGKNILIVSHQRPLSLLEKAIKGYGFEKFAKIIINKKEIKTGEVRKINGT